MPSITRAIGVQRRLTLAHLPRNSASGRSGPRRKEYAGFSPLGLFPQGGVPATKASRLDSFALSRRFVGRLQANRDQFRQLLRHRLMPNRSETNCRTTLQYQLASWMPAAAGGCSTAEDQRTIALVQMLEQQHEQDASRLTGRPHRPIEHLVVASVVAVVAESHDA